MLYFHFWLSLSFLVTTCKGEAFSLAFWNKAMAPFTLPCDLTILYLWNVGDILSAAPSPILNPGI